MKLTVIGGGGVRTPLLIPALVRRQDTIDLRDVVLMDLDEEKLGLIAPLAQYAAEKTGARFRLTWTTDPVEALTGAGAVITTIRGGSERGRVIDEQIALERGVLGQETTGPGGFAMALRSIPAVAAYARQMCDLCPDAWLLNFTNPAGLVVQGLTALFPTLRIVGICDTPIGIHQQVAGAFGRTIQEVPITFFGLNHLSWMSQALVDGENVVPRIIADDALAARVHELALFDRGLLRLIGMIPNEYLFFYYYRERAVANIRAAQETRGEQVLRLSGELVRDLQEIVPAKHPRRGWRRYQQYLNSRHGSYMATETGSEHQDAPEEEAEDEPSLEGGEGYAGVALDILTASAGRPSRMVVNVPNQGAIPGMADDDVVETVCRCDADGLHPVPTEYVPDDAFLLMRQVKRYERLTVEAVLHRSRERAIEALMVHPLVGSYSLATSLVDAYLSAHRDVLGEWNAA